MFESNYSYYSRNYSSIRSVPIFLCLSHTLTISAPSQKNILKILLNFARTLGFKGWGIFCDQILFHRMSNFASYIRWF